MEKVIGEIFNYEGIKLEVNKQSGSGCGDCYFRFNFTCMNAREIIGECSSLRRRDRSSVIFKEVTEEEIKIKSNKNPATEEDGQTIIKENKVKKLLKYWKKKLKLQAYNIEIDTDVDLSESKCVGWCEWQTTLRLGRIKIAKHDSIIELEKTLVHELFHIKFDLIQDQLDSGAYSVLHQHIEDLAVTLVDLKHKKETCNGN